MVCIAEVSNLSKAIVSLAPQGIYRFSTDGEAGWRLGREICRDLTHMLTTGGISMADLKKSYSDIRGRTHTVEHIIIPVEDKAVREQIIEDLFCALTQIRGRYRQNT